MEINKIKNKMSKETLKTLILEKFPDNTSQEISPEDLRIVQEAVVDEMALEQKISELPKVTELKNEAQFVIEQDGLNTSVSGEQLKKFVGNVGKDGYTSMAQVTLKPNIRGDQNILTQGMVSDSNTIYKIENDFELNKQLIIPEDVILDFQGGSITAFYEHNIVLNNTELKGEVNLGTFVSGNIKNKDFQSKWFIHKEDFIKSIANTDGYKDLIFEKTEYLLDTNIRIPKGVNMYGNNCTINVTWGGIVFQMFDTGTTEVAQFTKDVVKGDLAINITDASNIKVGDVLFLRNYNKGSFSKYTADYQEGEMIVVASIEGNVVKPTAPQIYGNYPVDNCKIFKKELNKIEVKDFNFNIEGNNLPECIRLHSLINSEVSNINVNRGYQCISVYSCLNTTIKNCKLVSKKDDDSLPRRDVYGVVIASSQSITVRDSYIKGGNHAVSCGGPYGDVPEAIINRFHRYENLICVSDGVTLCSLDFHGNSEYGYINNCKATGVIAGGGDILIENSTFSGTGDVVGYIQLVGRTTLNATFKNIECNDIAIVFPITDENYSYGHLKVLNSNVKNLIRVNSTFGNHKLTINNCEVGSVESTGEIFITDSIINKPSILSPHKESIIQNNYFTDLAIFTISPSVEIPFLIIRNNVFANNAPAHFDIPSGEKITTLIIKDNTVMGATKDNSNTAFRILVEVEVLYQKDNLFFPNLAKSSSYFILATKINNLIGNEIFQTHDTDSLLNQRVQLPTSMKILPTLIKDSTIVIKSKSHSSEGGMSSLILKDPRTLTLTSTDVGYQAMWVKKPIWWDGTKWIDAMGTEIIFP